MKTAPSDCAGSQVATAATLAGVMAIVLVALTVVLTQSAQAQTYTVLYNFTGGSDGAYPAAGVTLDRGGNLYGTTSGGGIAQNGTVFKLTHRGSGWTLNPLYRFAGGTDGSIPQSPVIFGPDGNLYGTTYVGGGTNCAGGAGCGMVFKVTPPATACLTALCPWIEHVLYRFTGGSDGGVPGWGSLVFDSHGNLYGTTIDGGNQNCPYGGCGVVFEISPSSGGWSDSTVYSFDGSSDGQWPIAGVIFDAAGNLYGAADGGALGAGTVYQLVNTGSGWTLNTLHTFSTAGDGGYTLWAGVALDQSDNVYGGTFSGGSGGGGTLFELSAGNWNFSLLYSFTGESLGLSGSLTMDRSGNFYGVTEGTGAYKDGTVFKLRPS